jgi:hypothetical protein
MLLAPGAADDVPVGPLRGTTSFGGALAVYVYLIPRRPGGRSTGASTGSRVTPLASCLDLLFALRRSMFVMDVVSTSLEYVELVMVRN